MTAAGAGTARPPAHRTSSRFLCVVLGAAISALAMAGAQPRPSPAPGPPGHTQVPGAPRSAEHPTAGSPATTARAPHRNDAEQDSTAATPPADPAGELAYRVEVRTDDAATADFPEVVRAVLTDPRGWGRAGVTFVRDPEARHRIIIAEGGEVDRLCAPYDTGGRFSCQNGPVVAINADRWRRATEAWPGDLATYRVMLINHEVGHLLHLHHPDPQCPAPGLPSPVMAQQSSGPGACRAHPWPLQWEVELAAKRREPPAPSADHDPSGHRPEPPAARR